MRYETFEHQADIGIRGSGANLEQAFAGAAAALFSVIVDLDAVRPEERRSVSVHAPDRELLLVEWLNALLSLADTERMVFSRFSLAISGDSLTGEAWGERLDRGRHQPKVEVKAATYHQLRIVEEQGMFMAQCVVDV